MVRGSGSESGDKESNKSVYDGTLKKVATGQDKAKVNAIQQGIVECGREGALHSPSIAGEHRARRRRSEHYPGASRVVLR